MQVNRTLSKRVAKALDEKPRNAWRLAWRALQSHSDLKNGLYVEGWAVPPDGLSVFEHGWLEVDGRIVDPTRWCGQLAYFPALRFDRDQVGNKPDARAKLPLSWRYTSQQPVNPAYRLAWQAANALAESQRKNRGGTRDWRSVTKSRAR